MAEHSVKVDQDGTAHPIKLATGQAHRLVVSRPHVNLVRLIGMFFDLNKCFLLPSAMRGIHKVRSVYDGHPGAQLLVVGHTDRSGDPAINDPLSLERSRAVVAYLTDDVDTWLAFYGPGIAPEKRWGATEDRLMLSKLPDGKPPFAGPGDRLSDAVRRFQVDRGLTVDGIAGPETRRALITAYMQLDGTSLPKGTTTVAHGCGESFPDVATANGVREARNRRVEIFVFDGTIKPPPSGELSGPEATDYPAWKARVANIFDFTEDDENDTLELRLHDQSSIPLASTFYRVVAGGAEPAQGQAGADGFIQLDLPSNGLQPIEIEWGSDDPSGPFQFFRTIFIPLDHGDDDQLDKFRLHNLGYNPDLDFVTAARAFQVDYQVDHLPAPLGLQGGSLPPASRQQLDQIFGALNCDATPGGAS